MDDLIEIRPGVWVNTTDKNAKFFYKEWDTGKIIKARRKQLRMTQGELGAKVGVTKSTISRYESGEKPELSIKNRFMIPKDLELRELGVHHVEYSECDMNMHMNNTQYHNMLWNRIDGMIGKELTSINIKFRTEARYDSDIVIYGAKLEDDELSGDSRAEEVYVFHTETEGRTNVEALIGVRKLRDEVPEYLRKIR